MSVEEANQFIHEVIQDEELKEEFDEELGLTSEDGPADREDIVRRISESAPSFARERGYDFTGEQGLEALGNLEENLSTSELTDEELENVAGGANKTAKDHRENAVSVFTAVIGCLVSASQGSECTVA